MYPDQVPTQGITGVTLADVAYAESCGKKIKLLGGAIHRPDGRVCAFVAPHLVDLRTRSPEWRTCSTPSPSGATPSET